MSRLPRRLWSAVLLSIVLVAAACTSSSGSSSTSGGGGTGGNNATLTVGATAEPSTLDLTVNTAAAIPQVLLYNVYEGLVKLDQNGHIKPLLAKSWDVSSDRRTYTFHLQPNATFSNGDPVTAKSVVFSIDRVLAPNSKHPFKSQMEPVQSATAKDAHTVVVKLKEPSNNWLFYMTSTVGIVFDKNAIGTIATKPVGSGPFVFQSWNRGTSITLARNNHYWGQKAHVGKVVFRYFSDPNAMNNAMLAGDLSMISNVQAPQTLTQFKDASRFVISEGTTNGEVVMSMNNAKGALKDKRVRQAICYAVNRKALVKTVWSGYGKLIGSMVPPTDPWYEDLSNYYPYNPAKAKQLLAQAGYSHGLSLQMKLPTLPYAVGAGQFVASQLKAVGINAQISQLEFPSRWLDTVFTKGDYDISIIAHVEPRDIVQYGSPDYYFHYNNPKVQQWLAQADKATPKEQIVIMKKVARQLAADAASDWLFLLPNLIVTQKGITGYPKNAVSLSFDVTNVRVSNS